MGGHSCCRVSVPFALLKCSLIYCASICVQLAIQINQYLFKITSKTDSRRLTEAVFYCNKHERFLLPACCVAAIPLPPGCGSMVKGVCLPDAHGPWLLPPGLLRDPSPAVLLKVMRPNWVLTSEDAVFDSLLQSLPTGVGPPACCLNLPPLDCVRAIQLENGLDIGIYCDLDYIFWLGVSFTVRMF